MNAHCQRLSWSLCQLGIVFGNSIILPQWKECKGLNIGGQKEEITWQGFCMHSYSYVFIYLQIRSFIWFIGLSNRKSLLERYLCLYPPPLDTGHWNPILSILILGSLKLWADFSTPLMGNTGRGRLELSCDVHGKMIWRSGIL